MTLKASQPLGYTNFFVSPNWSFVTNFPYKLLEAAHWRDYELLDSGDGQKLERFGPYRFARPEAQAMWRPALAQSEWNHADAFFQPTSEESGGNWKFNRKIDEKWEMSYELAENKARLRFWAMTTPGRHLGVFPEAAAYWDFIYDAIDHRVHGEHGEVQKNISVNSEAKVLNLFGYTGLATLSAAAAGAQVTHVDASKKSVSWARDNQELSGLGGAHIRWLVEDALKYVQREARRGVKYDGIILDPPKFGRGPKGQVWEVYESLPALLEACRACLSEAPLFVIVSMYAVRASAIHLAQTLEELMKSFGGSIECGELITREKSADRVLSHAVYARWNSTAST